MWGKWRRFGRTNGKYQENTWSEKPRLIYVWSLALHPRKKKTDCINLVQYAQGCIYSCRRVGWLKTWRRYRQKTNRSHFVSTHVRNSIFLEIWRGSGRFYKILNIKALYYCVILQLCKQNASPNFTFGLSTLHPLPTLQKDSVSEGYNQHKWKRVFKKK